MKLDSNILLDRIDRCLVSDRVTIASPDPDENEYRTIQYRRGTLIRQLESLTIRDMVDKGRLLLFLSDIADNLLEGRSIELSIVAEIYG